MEVMRADRGPAVPRQGGPGGLAGGGQALFRLVRYWSRRWAADAAGAARAGSGHAAQVGHVLILEAIDAARQEDGIGAAGTGAAGTGAIGEVARQLGLDRSNASRMLAAAVAAGLVTKATSPADARATVLGITPAGEELLAAARAWQDAAFARLVAGWPARDARQLAAYLRRLAGDLRPRRRPSMSIVLNHTIVWVADKRSGAQFLADLLGLTPGEQTGPFIPVRVNADLTLDFDDRGGGGRPAHYAFLVDDATFDRALQLVRDRKLPYGSGPRVTDYEINHLGGGRGMYVRDPDEIAWELFTAVPA